MANMRNKGNIIKFLDNGGKACELVCKCLSSNTRNSIGHYDYDSEEIANSLGQKIKFYNVNNKDEFEEKTLTQICYDIWQMYNCMGVFSELIYRLEMHSRILEGQHPSEGDDFCKTTSGCQKNRKKIYPNDKCPCGSGLKYKKCCGK
ncbi:MAG TPA: SEC-C domain-containing protein [Candidatus Lachnoclostridium stercoravium]|uniref:SEC-C domain-containing protein n=1 Tax=Candidatus Lachnoclostridium stercoravium TaxID=2838633 RepID=A0A9D2HEQ8_9FIRM|nr:SEC-C domain-containing protein [Candidatus Lachnoclostridium stercoravium]